VAVVAAAIAPLASLAAAAATATANAAYLRYSPHMSKLCTCQLDQPVWIRCSNTLDYRVYQDLRDICNSKRLQQSPENLKGISIFHIIFFRFRFHSHFIHKSNSFCMLDSICIIHQYAYAENVVITRGVRSTWERS